MKVASESTILNAVTNGPSSIAWTKLVELWSQTLSKLSYELSLRSSSTPRSSFLFRNFLVKLIDFHGKFTTANTITGSNAHPSNVDHRALSSLMLRSNTATYVAGDLNVWSMFGIVIGAVVALICFYYIVNCVIQRQVEERNTLRSIEEIPLVPSGGASRRSARNSNN